MYRKSARRSRPPGRSTRIASSRTSTPARRVSSAANGKLRAQPLIGRRVQDKSTGASYGWRHERCQPQTRRGASWPAGTSSGSPRRTRHTPPAPGSEPLTRWDLPAVVQPPPPGTPVGVDQRADQRLHRPTQPSRHHRRGVRPQPAGGTRTVFPSWYQRSSRAAAPSRSGSVSWRGDQSPWRTSWRVWWAPCWRRADRMLVATPG